MKIYYGLYMWMPKAIFFIRNIGADEFIKCLIVNNIVNCLGWNCHLYIYNFVLRPFHPGRLPIFPLSIYCGFWTISWSSRADIHQSDPPLPLIISSNNFYFFFISFSWFSFILFFLLNYNNCLGTTNLISFIQIMEHVMLNE